MAEHPTTARRASPHNSNRLAQVLAWLLLAASVALYAIHFLHLSADFPNNSPWVDWSKYTDEGWYGDAAIRHYLTGHWYWKGDFNPAVALPVWPALELLWFHFTGVSPASARALTLIVFGLTLLSFYFLLRRFARIAREGSSPSLAPALCIFLLTASPLFFVFERMAILEPLLILLTVLALWCAALLGGNRHEIRDTGYGIRPQVGTHSSHLASRISYLQRISHLVSLWWPTLALGILIPAMVLTKTTALFLVPAIAFMVWARAGYRLRHTLRLGLPPAVIAIALWLAYFLCFVRPRYLEDYRYLFSANAYTGILLEPFEKVILATFADGVWMGHALYIAFYAVLVLMLFWRPRLLRNPLIPALLLWAIGYVAFLAYHNNLQPRYYLVVAAPITAIVALGLDGFRQAVSRRREAIASVLITALAIAIAAPGLQYELWIATHPTYEFLSAAQAVARIVRADKTHSNLILSISGSDITLMTGLPSIDDDFGTMELSQRVRAYQPGWYIAWNELDDDKMDALTPEFHPVRVAAFPALDDPDRNLLIVYRLDPGPAAAPTPTRHRRPTPRPLQTKVGQQPTTQQLEH